MMKPKKITEEQLYRTIGEIDDRIVAEAIAYRKPKKHPANRWILTIPTIAAALLILLVSLPLMRKDSIGNGVKDPSQSEAPVLWSVTESYSANTALLTCLSECSTLAHSSETAPILSKGTAQIIWKDLESGVYYTVTIPTEELFHIRHLMRNTDPAKEIDRGNEAPPFLLWIADGNGFAASPYLPLTNGTLFAKIPSDYAPEYLPSELFAEFLEELIREYAD